MKASIRNEYARLRKAGWIARWALSHAKTMDHFATLEAHNLVRLEWHPDHDATIEDLGGDTYRPECHPDIPESRIMREKKEFIELVEREGAWGLVGQYSVDGGKTWNDGGSIWGLVGQEDTGYESDIIDETVEALRKALKERCPKCRQACAA